MGFPLISNDLHSPGSAARSGARGAAGAAARSAASIVIYACSGVVAVVVAAADETSHAEARRAKPSQASQSRDRLTNGIGYICDVSPCQAATHNWLRNWMYPVCEWTP